MSALLKDHAHLSLIIVCRGRTNVLGHSSDPHWQEHFEVLVADEVDDISFTVKDDNWIGVSSMHSKGSRSMNTIALHMLGLHNLQLMSCLNALM